MKRKIISMILAIIILVTGMGFETHAAVTRAEGVTVSYRTHVQTFGWQDWKFNGEMSGTTGMAKRLEGIEIKVSGANLGVKYTTHVQSYGWQPWVSNGTMSGTSGQAKRLEAIKIVLTGSDADKYDIYYRVHAQHFGWMNWVKNGEAAGTAGYAYRLEAIQIVITAKSGEVYTGAEYPKSTSTVGYVSRDGSTDASVPDGNDSGTEIPVSNSFGVTYRTHVQTYGWQGWKLNGEMSGTSGKAKRLEGINIRLVNTPYSGGITYRTHVQTFGWQSWVSDGVMSGTSGQAKRLEGIEIKLTGEMANHYDVYYRTHVQTYGWQDWKKNGEMSGTSGQAKRLEGIEIKLVAKQSGSGTTDPDPDNVDTGNAVCKHNWTEATEVIHHDAEYGPYLISEAWDEPVYESTWKCYGYETICGFWVFQSKLKEYADEYCDGNRMDAFIMLHEKEKPDSDCPIGGYGTGPDKETGEIIHHEAEYGTHCTKAAWDEYVTYEYCSKCGVRK